MYPTTSTHTHPSPFPASLLIYNSCVCCVLLFPGPLMQWARIRCCLFAACRVNALQPHLRSSFVTRCLPSSGNRIHIICCSLPHHWAHSKARLQEIDPTEQGHLCKAQHAEVCCSFDRNCNRLNPLLSSCVCRQPVSLSIDWTARSQARRLMPCRKLCTKLMGVKRRCRQCLALYFLRMFNFVPEPVN